MSSDGRARDKRNNVLFCEDYLSIFLAQTMFALPLIAILSVLIIYRYRTRTHTYTTHITHIHVWWISWKNVKIISFSLSSNKKKKKKKSNLSVCRRVGGKDQKFTLGSSMRFLFPSFDRLASPLSLSTVARQQNLIYSIASSFEIENRRKEKKKKTICSIERSNSFLSFIYCLSLFHNTCEKIDFEFLDLYSLCVCSLFIFSDRYQCQKQIPWTMITSRSSALKSRKYSLIPQRQYQVWPPFIPSSCNGTPFIFKFRIIHRSYGRQRQDLMHRWHQQIVNTVASKQ